MGLSVTNVLGSFATKPVSVSSKQTRKHAKTKYIFKFMVQCWYCELFQTKVSKGFQVRNTPVTQSGCLNAQIQMTGFQCCILLGKSGCKNTN